MRDERTCSFGIAESAAVSDNSGRRASYVVRADFLDNIEVEYRKDCPLQHWFGDLSWVSPMSLGALQVRYQELDRPRESRLFQPDRNHQWSRRRAEPKTAQRPHALENGQPNGNKSTSQEMYAFLRGVK